LRYDYIAAMPYSVLYQMVIVLIGSCVVLWDGGLPLRMLGIVLITFVVCIGFYKLLLRRIQLMRLMFGMER
jgi:glucans biosynthesis protein C